MSDLSIGGEIIKPGECKQIAFTVAKLYDFTDMKMPKGMSGHELAENLKALKPDLKVIYTSGYSPEVAGYDLELQEEMNFLPKPYPPSTLLRIVRNCLNSQEAVAA